MKARTVYNRIDRTIYEFSEADIKKALLDAAKVTYRPGRQIDFEIDFDDQGVVTAKIVEIYEYHQKEDQPDAKPLEKYEVVFPNAKHGIAGDAEVGKVDKMVLTAAKPDGSLEFHAFVEADSQESALLAAAALYHEMWDTNASAN